MFHYIKNMWIFKKNSCTMLLLMAYCNNLSTNFSNENSFKWIKSIEKGLFTLVVLQPIFINTSVDSSAILDEFCSEFNCFSVKDMPKFLKAHQIMFLNCFTHFFSWPVPFYIHHCTVIVPILLDNYMWLKIPSFIVDRHGAISSFARI